MRTGNYDLSQALPESNFRSFQARHLITGREVLVHFLSQGGRSLTEVIGGLSAEARAMVLDAGEQEGAAYLVTVPMAGFTTLEAWLSQSGGVTVPVPLPVAVAVPIVPAMPESSGEFTQLFAGGPPPKAPTAKVPNSLPEDDGGSFTQMFQPEKSAPAARFPAPPAAAPPAAAPPAAAPGSGAATAEGSFTQFFQPMGAEPSAPPAPPVSGPPGGEFTEIFQRSSLPAPPVPARNAEPPRPAAWPAESRSSDFTEFFQGTPAPPAPSRATPPVAPLSSTRPPASSADPMGGATEFFRGPLPAPVTPTPGRGIAPPAGPSDFTAMVGGRGTAFPAPARGNPLPPLPGEWPPFSSAMPPVPSMPSIPSMPSMPSSPALPSMPPPPAVAIDSSNRKMVLVGVLSFVIMIGFMAIVYLLVRK